MNVQGNKTPAKWQKMVKKIWQLIHEDRRHQTIHELADTGGISYGVCQEILKENLNMPHSAVKFVPWFLTNDQKQRHINACLELQEKANEDQTIISMIIKGDKSCIYGYDPETKKQSLQRNSLHSPRAKRRSRYGVQQRACSLFFFMWRELFTVNLFLLTLWSTWAFSVTFWGAWEKMCDKKARNFGATTTGSFITINARNPHIPENHRVCD
jgi:hypothetical protein